MKNKKSLIVLGVIVVLAIVGIGIYKNRQQTVDDNVIRIGAILPLTGPIAIDGEELLTGVKLAQQDCLEMLKRKVEIEIEDGKFDPKESVASYNKLKLNNIQALIVAGDGPSEALAPLINRDRMITMSPLTGSLNIQNCSPWMFRCWFYVPFVAEHAASFIKTQLGINSASVFYNDTLYGDLSAKSFQNEFQRQGGTIAGYESYPFMATSARNETARLLRQNPKAIYVTGYGLGFITAMNQLKETSFNGTIVSDNALADVMVLNSIKDASNIYFVDLAFSSKLIAHNKDAADFAQKYLEMTGKSKVSNQAIMAYVSTMILAQSYVKDPDIMKQHIIASKGGVLSSLVGDIDFSDKGEIILPLVIKRHGVDGREEIVESMNAK